MVNSVQVKHGQDSGKKNVFQSIKSLFSSKQDENYKSGSATVSSNSTLASSSSNISLPISEYYSSQKVEFDASRDSSPNNSRTASPSRLGSSTISSLKSGSSSSKVYYDQRLKSEHYMLPYQPPERKDNSPDRPPTPVQKQVVYVPPIDPFEPVSGNAKVHSASQFTTAPILSTLPRSGQTKSEEAVASAKEPSSSGSTPPPRPKNPPKVPAKTLAPLPTARPAKGILKTTQNPNTEELNRLQMSQAQSITPPPPPPPRPRSLPKSALEQPEGTAKLNKGASKLVNTPPRQTTGTPLAISPRSSSVGMTPQTGTRRPLEKRAGAPYTKSQNILTSSIANLKAGIGSALNRSMSHKSTGSAYSGESLAPGELQRSKSGIKRVKSRRQDYANRLELDVRVYLPVPEVMAESHGGLYEMPPDIAKAVRSKCCMRTGTRWTYVTNSKSILVEGFEKDKVKEAVDVFVLWIRRYEPHYNPKI